MSLKSTIMSKKQKLNEKKFSKGKTPNMIDLVQSSEDDHYRSHERVQKRSKYSGKPVNSVSANQQIKPYVPKMLDLSRIQSAATETKRLTDKVIYQSIKEIDDCEGLLVVETAEQQNPDTVSRERSLFSYKIEGKDGIKYVSEMHIKGRISSEIKDIQKKQYKKAEREQSELEKIMEGIYPSDAEGANAKSQKNKKQIQNEKQGEQPAQRKRAARYFEDGESDDEGQQNVVKCFRCYKRGHIAKNCIEQEPKQSCNFCLGEHHQAVCDSSPCFRCCQPGHISQDCQSKAIECRKCKKRGHKSDKCGIYMPLDYHNKDDDYIKNRFRKTDLKKLKCLKFCKNPDGHFNCFTYNPKYEPHPYASLNTKKTNYEKGNDRYRNNRGYQRRY